MSKKGSTTGEVTDNPIADDTACVASTVMAGPGSEFGVNQFGVPYITGPASDTHPGTGTAYRLIIAFDQANTFSSSSGTCGEGQCDWITRFSTLFQLRDDDGSWGPIRLRNDDGTINRDHLDDYLLWHGRDGTWPRFTWNDTSGPGSGVLVQPEGPNGGAGNSQGFFNVSCFAPCPGAASFTFEASGTAGVVVSVAARFECTCGDN